MWTSCFLVTWTNVNWFILSWANWTLSQLLWGVNSLWLTALSSKFSHSFGSRSRSQCLKSSLVLLVSVLFTEWKSGLWFFISQHNSTNILSNASHYFIAPPNDKYYYKAPRWSFPPPDHEYLIICCLFLSQHIFLGGVCVVVFFFFFFTNECDDTLIAGCSQADVQWLLIECGGLVAGGYCELCAPAPP